MTGVTGLVDLQTVSLGLEEITLINTSQVTRVT